MKILVMKMHSEKIWLFVLLTSFLTDRCIPYGCDYCGACYNGCNISSSSEDIVGTVEGSSSSWYYCLNSIETYDQLSKYEIRVIGAYESENWYNWNGYYHPGTITVDLQSCIDYDFDYYSDVFAKPTILFLTSYYPVYWIIDSSDWIVINNINLAGIYVSSTYHQYSNISIANSGLKGNNNYIYKYYGNWGYGYGDDCGYANIHNVLKIISNSFGDDAYSFLGMLEMDTVYQCVGKQSNQYATQLQYTTKSPVDNSDYSTTTIEGEWHSSLVIDLGNDIEQTLTIFVVYCIGSIIFIMFCCMSVCHTKYQTFNHIKALKNHENTHYNSRLSLSDLIQLLCKSEWLDVASIIFEIIDIVSDIWLASTLVSFESYPDFDDSLQYDAANEQLFRMGIFSFIFTLFGTLCFVIKIVILRQLYTIILFNKNAKQFIINLNINGKRNKQYNKTLMSRDVIMWDMFTGAMEDIPQTLIAITAMIVLGHDAPVATQASVFISVWLIIWKLVRLFFNINFGNDMNESLPMKEICTLHDQKSHVSQVSQVSQVAINDANENNHINNNNKQQQARPELPQRDYIYMMK